MISDLKQEILHLQTQGYDIVLMFDANESLEANHLHIAQLVMETHLANVHMTHQTSESTPLPGTYSRGTRKIDFIFLSPSLLPFIHKVGLQPLHELITSDHRGLFVDIKLGYYLKGQPPPCTSFASRLLNSHHARQVSQYKKKLTIYLHNHCVFERAHKLQEMSVDSAIPEEDIRLHLNKLNEDLLQGMLHAERKSCSSHHNPWSPAVINARNLIRYWESLMTEYCTGNDLSQQRKLLLPTLDPPPVPLLLLVQASIHRNLRAAHCLLCMVLHKADTLRDQFLQERSLHYATTRDQDAEVLLRNMRKIEANCHMFNRFRIVMGTVTQGALSSLRVPDPNSSAPNAYVTLYDPQEIEERLLQRNQAHFSQATGTPFTIPPQSTQIGRHAEHGFQGALEALCDATDEATIALLEHALSYQLPAISCIITADDIIAKFRVWKESTSTSPNGNHLGHYKALLVPDAVKTDPSREEEASHADEARPIFEVMAALLTASFQRGLVANRWLTVYSAMIEKIPGNPLINKLRVIHLFDCLWNLGLGVIWSCRLLPHAESHSTINNGQWGSRKGCRAIDCVAVKEFTYEITRYTHTDLVTLDNDTKSCYDRIAMAYALLQCKQLGLPDSAAKALGTFLNNAHYHIKTQLGAFEKFYTNGDDGLIQHAPGQGSLEGPPLWVIVSSGPMDILCNRYTELQFNNPDLSCHARSLIQGFVNDVGTTTNDFWKELHCAESYVYNLDNDMDHLRQLLTTASNMAQFWEKLLWATVGKLEVPKCFIYVLHWTFDAREEAHLMSQQDLLSNNIHITIVDSKSSNPTPITILDCDTHSRTLGVHITPSGKSHPEAQRLIDKSTHLGLRLKTSCLTPMEGFAFYRSIYQPSLFYTLPISYLSVREGDAIMAASTGPLLNACGFHSNFPRALTFASRSSGGLGFSHIYNEQGCQHICTLLLPHLRDPTGQLQDFLCVLYHWAHLVCGFAEPPLMTTTLRAPHLPQGWIASTVNTSATLEQVVGPQTTSVLGAISVVHTITY